MTDLSAQAVPDDIDRRLPTGDQIFLDHIGHFVHDGQAASRALARCGFAPTPVSIQVNSDPAGGTRPTGMGNVTAMLSRGYLEILFKTSDTPLSREFDTALSCHAGLHLAAFAVADAAKAHRRLATNGFRVRELVHMQRPVGTAAVAATAEFTIARVEPDAMPEGRIQMLTHHTEQAVWQERWLKHPNSASGLIDLVIAVADVEEAALRFARFTGRAVTRTPGRCTHPPRPRRRLPRHARPSDREIAGGDDHQAAFHGRLCATRAIPRHGRGGRRSRRP